MFVFHNIDHGSKNIHCTNIDIHISMELTLKLYFYFPEHWRWSRREWPTLGVSRIMLTEVWHTSNHWMQRKASVSFLFQWPQLLDGDRGVHQHEQGWCNWCRDQGSSLSSLPISLNYLRLHIFCMLCCIRKFLTSQCVLITEVGFHTSHHSWWAKRHVNYTPVLLSLMQLQLQWIELYGFICICWKN